MATENTVVPEALRNSPTEHGLRGDYSAMHADWTVEQPFSRYSSQEHGLWRTLYARQSALVKDYAAPAFTASLQSMDCAEGIPDFEKLSARLRKATGWEIACVPGLLPDEVFYDHLAHRRFPASWWIRKPEELDYLVEPDVFHDLFGHVPLLFDPVFADYMQEYGKGGPKAIAHGAVNVLARLYWYMVEFGLIKVDGEIKAYGAGMLSSFGETKYSVDSPVPNRIGFDLERVMRTRYLIDRFQSTYFVLDSFEQLFRMSMDTDFAPLYDAIKAETAFASTDIAPGDAVIHRGTHAN